jgi:hypothetical protein
VSERVDQEHGKELRDAHRTRYAEHSRTLQTWIGAYGVGLASLLVYQFRTALDDVLPRFHYKDAYHAKQMQMIDFVGNVKATGAAMAADLNLAFNLIALAISLQVVLLLVNKATQFRLAHAPRARQQWKPLDRAAERVSGWFLLDIGFDIASVALLAWATVAGLKALAFMPG